MQVSGCHNSDAEMDVVEAVTTKKESVSMAPEAEFRHGFASCREPGMG